jgi:lipoate-protein ligase A
LRWRVIPLEIHDAFTNMALDEAVAESVAAGSLPTVRFYRWRPSAVSIGYFQSMIEEVDVDECRRRGVDLVRRRTGGGAVYHDFEGEITYSLIAPQDLYGSDIQASYRVICAHVIQALALLGLKAEFRPINDLVVNGRKISGNAQTRRGGVLLQHGTVLHGLDVEVMSGVLKVDQEKLRERKAGSISGLLTSITDELGEIPMGRTYNALLRGFTDDKIWGFGSLGAKERQRARILVAERYGTREWNFLR